MLINSQISRQSRRNFIILFTFVFVLFSLPACKDESSGPTLENIYLTFPVEDTAHNITVNYHTRNLSMVSYIHYDTEPRLGNKELYQFSAKGVASGFPASERTMHSITLNELEAGQTYYFIVGDDLSGYSQEYHFKTLPADDSPVHIVQGGDMNTDPVFVDISKSAIEKEPDVIFVGGDIAYANGFLTSLNRWDDWFKNMSSVVIRPDNRVIPLIVAIGNHEVNNTVFGSPEKKMAPWYFTFFPQNGVTTYFARQLGAHTTVFVLDTDHIAKSDKDQAAWLRDSMAKYEDRSNKLALYHVPLYPSVRDYEGSASEKLRVAWLNIFDQYGLTLAFENHDHALKRTKMLRNGQVVSSGGTVFVGDGCWGKSTRTPTNKWYLDMYQAKKHVWEVEASRDGLSLQASGEAGVIYDQFTISTLARQQILSNLPHQVQRTSH